MLDDNANAGNWEQQICELVDKAVEMPHECYEICEEIIEIVEDLLFIAYVRGRNFDKK